MGIVSTNPGIVGNRKDGYENNPQYVIVGMLGQVPAKASTENGDIRPGDSLTSASVPGYIMRADAGDPTVGVALEGLTSPQSSPYEGEEVPFLDKEGLGEVYAGVINVLISRRNKSITVEEVEEKVVERVAEMEIEDEVNILIANAINSLDLEDEINETIDPKLLLLSTQLTVQTDDLSGRISNTESVIADIAGALNQFHNDIGGLQNDITNLQFTISNFQTIFNNTVSSLNNTFTIDNEGNIKLGDGISTTTPSVAIVEIITATTTIQTAFVVNQAGQGDVADFQYNEVSVMNINNQGKVSVVGELLVDGRIMTCSGGACGETLDNAVDETMGDIGVEGKVVAGAFEGYCDDGYIWVPGSAKYGTMPGFCVMGYKAAQDENNLPTSLSKGGEGGLNAWVNISQGEAQIACQNIDSGYHLISENEWLTIAENIMRVAENDIDTDVDGMQLATSSSPLQGEAGVRFTLTNDNSIYEFVDEISEWTDQLVTSAGIMTPVSDDWQEYYEITDYKGFNIAPPYYYSSTNGIGTIKTGLSSNLLRGFVRGETGIYGLDLSNSPTMATSTIGFRCAK